MTIAGDTALVTGAGTGIGESIANALAEEGLEVVVTDIDEAAMEGTVADIETAGGEATAIRIDVGDSESVADGVNRARELVGTIDVLVNNAGIKGPTADVENVSLEDWDRTLSVNLRGAFLLCRELVPAMKEQGYGRIVNVSSAAAKRPVPQRAPYTASKTGMIGLTQTVAAEAGEHDVNVNAVCPGAVEGPRIRRVIEREAEESDRSFEEVGAERRRQGLRKELTQPEDVAGTVVFLCSSAAERITGQTINISAGNVVS